MDQSKRKWPDPKYTYSKSSPVSRSNPKYTYSKKSKYLSLESGMTGFLCTCNFREKECIRDAYRILEEFAAEVPPPPAATAEVTSENKQQEGKPSDKDVDEDVSDALNKEIKELHEQAKKPAKDQKFQYIDTGAKNVIFIRATLPDLVDLTLKIVKNLDETKTQRSRFLLRFIPILTICKANLSEIKQKGNELLSKYFSQEPKSFSIVFNRHCNNTIERMEVIDTLAAVISEKNPGNKADLKNPDIAVIVEIIKGWCLLAVAPDYYKYKKYNLLELCNVKEDLEKSSKESVDEEPSSDPIDLEPPKGE